MVYELKCKNCGTMMYYDTAKPLADEFPACENCKTYLTGPSETRLRNINLLPDFELVAIKKEFPRSVLDEDFERIIALYEAADETTRNKIYASLDRVYLIINSGDKTRIDELYDVIKYVFFKDKGTVI